MSRASRQAEPLDDDSRLVRQREDGRWRQRREYLFVPEAVVLGTPLRDALEALALVEGEAQVGIAHPYDLDREQLNDADRLAGGVDDGLELAGHRQRRVLELP